MIIEVIGQITAMSEKQAVTVSQNGGGVFYKRITLIKPEGCDEGYYKRNVPLQIEFSGYNVDKPIDCKKFDRVSVEVVIRSRAFKQRDGKVKYYTSLEGRDVTILERHPQP